VTMSWPLHALTLTTPDLVLRGTTETDALRMAEVFPDDVGHDPTLAVLPGDHRVLQKYWQSLAAWRPDDWNLWLTVRREGEVIGAQGLEGKDFEHLRTVETWSWLVPGARGQGLGKQMRAAVLHLAFTHLGADRATTEAWDDNAASLGVSRALGYRDNGVDRRVRRPHSGEGDGWPAPMQRLLLKAADWQCPAPVTVTGLVPCLPLLGV